MEDCVDRADWHNEASAQADGGNDAAPDELVGETARDAEELAGLLDGDGQRLVRLVSVHKLRPTPLPGWRDGFCLLRTPFERRDLDVRLADPHLGSRCGTS